MTARQVLSVTVADAFELVAYDTTGPTDRVVLGFAVQPNESAAEAVDAVLAAVRARLLAALRPDVGQQVAFPTNADTIADGVDGHVGVVLRHTPNGRRLVVGVEDDEYVCDPDDVYPVD